MRGIFDHPQAAFIKRPVDVYETWDDSGRSSLAGSFGFGFVVLDAEQDEHSGGGG